MDTMLSKRDRSWMRYRYLVDFRHGIAVLGTPQGPPLKTYVVAPLRGPFYSTIWKCETHIFIISYPLLFLSLNHSSWLMGRFIQYKQLVRLKAGSFFFHGYFLFSTTIYFYIIIMKNYFPLLFEVIFIQQNETTFCTQQIWECIEDLPLWFLTG